MKVVINSCYGGFSLSPLAVSEIAKAKGRECYFFKVGVHGEYVPCSLDDCGRHLWVAFDVPIPNDVLVSDEAWNALDSDGRVAANRLYDSHNHTCRPDDRTDPDLVEVVERLGEVADGKCASLRVVEIPDGVEFEIDDYDGIETIREKHRSWS